MFTPNPPWKSLYAGTVPLLEVHGVRVADLEVGGHAVREALHRALVQRLGGGRLREQVGGFALRDLGRARFEAFQIHLHLLEGPGNLQATEWPCKCSTCGGAASAQR